MSWVDLLTDLQRDELSTLKNLRDRAVSQVGRAYIELSRTRAAAAMAEVNLKTAENAVFEINGQMARRIQQALAGHNVGAVDIDDLV